MTSGNEQLFYDLKKERLLQLQDEGETSGVSELSRTDIIDQEKKIKGNTIRSLARQSRIFGRFGGIQLMNGVECKQSNIEIGYLKKTLIVSRKGATEVSPGVDWEFN